MKKFTSLFLILILGIFVCYENVYTKEDGAPAGVTGASGEATCGNSNCHNVSTNTGSGSFMIRLDTFTSQYEPGKTYGVIVDLTHVKNRFGFQATVLNSSGNKAGTITITDPMDTKFSSPAAGNGRQHITHTFAGTDPAPTGAQRGLWMFDWTAPAAGTGSVTIFAAGCGANNNGRSSGDEIYTTQLVLTEAVPMGINENALSKSLSFYPNPIQDKLNLNFTIEKQGTLEIALFDLNGKKVQNLYNQTIIAGEHQLNFDVNQLESGLYLLRMNQDGNTATQKILVE